MEISEMTQSVLEFGLSHIILELNLQNFFVDGHIIQVLREFIYLEKRTRLFCSKNLPLKKIFDKKGAQFYTAWHKTFLQDVQKISNCFC